MKVQDLMTTPVVTVTPGTSFKQIAERLARNGISAMPVVDQHGSLVGIVSEGDLLAKEAFGARRRKRRLLGYILDVLAGRDTEFAAKAAGLTAADIMTEQVITAAPTDDVRKIARRMLATGMKRFPVIGTDGKLAGIISRADLLRVFDRSDDALLGSVEQLVRRCLFMPPEADVKVDVREGIVTLHGEVHYDSDVAVLGAIVAAADGVIAVENELAAREPDPVPVR